ncbi:MAG TPA: TIGR04551 family protein [Polyangia bacterium]|nr:TIGR04551 family protein [Polyangia bacterium]
MRLPLLLCLALCLPSLAAAQVMPGQPRPGGLPPTQPGGDEKEEGPAEQAPEEPEKEQQLQPLPGFSTQREKQLQFLELSGYLRWRGELWHNFNLGFHDSGTQQGVPFPEPIDCYPPVGTGTSNPRMEDPVRRTCDDNLSTANMRLRMEPTVNISEQVRVKAQIDFLDNLVLGSTPEGTVLGTQGVPGAAAPAPPPANVPIPGFNRTQVPPQAGRNSLTDSVQVKRAWAEVRTPFGELRFGRMPSHWGTGMFINSGDCTYNREGTDCLDQDYGSNADRVMFATRAFNLLIVGILDWAASGPTSDRLAFGLNQYQGEPFDATNRDDVDQYGLVVGRIDRPEDWREKVARGETVWNLATYLVRRNQDLDQPFNAPAPLGSTGSNAGTNLVKRGASANVADVWARLAWRHFLFEGEGAIIWGHIDSVREVAGLTYLDILQGGAMGRMTYSTFHDAIKLKLEVGFASGDQAEGTQPGQTNYQYSPVIQPPGDHTVTNFHFDPDYHVDLILFRRILGTVTNAIYAKPTFAWDITESFGTQLDVITSLPHIPVSTPGNGSMYGIEMDLSIGYRNVEEGFFAGFQYGVLFPMSALDHPGTGTANGMLDSAPLFSSGVGSASSAQTLRTYLAVKF